MKSIKESSKYELINFNPKTLTLCDGKTNKRTNERTYERTDEWTARTIYSHILRMSRYKELKENILSKVP